MAKSTGIGYRKTDRPGVSAIDNPATHNRAGDADGADKGAEVKTFKGPVECDLCAHEWIAERPEGIDDDLECPECHAMVGCVRNNPLGLPNWVYNFSRTCMKFFGLYPYNVQIRWVAEIKMTDPERPGDADGHADIDTRYMTVIISLRNTLKPDEVGYQTICHEFGHVIYAMYWAKTQSILTLLPAKYQVKENRELIDIEEAEIERQTREMAPILRDLKWRFGEEDGKFYRKHAPNGSLTNKGDG
jgi:hypothetical protein